MASFVARDFPEIGAGFTIKTQSIPLAGLLCVMRMARTDGGGLFRYSLDGGITYTEWTIVDEDSLLDCSKVVDTFDVILDYVVSVNDTSTPTLDNERFQYTIFNKTIYKNFFDANDVKVIGWAWNVLEKMYIHGVVPTYISRANVDDFNSFFLAITHLFAIIVVYARCYRKLEDNDVLIRTFLEQWGIVYETITTQQERNNIYSNWINEFSKRGTVQIAGEGTPNSELRRLLGYTKPSEFLFSILEPCNIGWCIGYSSPMWYGTEAVNAVSKGWDYGIDWLRGDSFRGIGTVSDYPIVGSLSKVVDKDGVSVFQTGGSGMSGIYSYDISKSMEIYSGMDYEVTIWVKALAEGNQNIDFGVNCFGFNGEMIKQVSLTDLKLSNSFLSEDADGNLCLIPNVWYRLRGVIYNVLTDKDTELYLNFKGGRPLKFANGTAYLAPYIVQDRNSSNVDIQIGGICLKPLYLFPRHQTYNLSIGDSVPLLMDGYPIQEHSWKNGAGDDMVTTISPVGQGFLGSKAVAVIYSQINSSRTKKDIEAFIKNNLLSYKDVFWGAWLDYICRSSYYLTFVVCKEIDGSPIIGAEVTLDNGLNGATDKDGYVRFEVETGATVRWAVNKKGVTVNGVVQVSSDRLVEVSLNIPVDINLSVYQENWGSIRVDGDLKPKSSVILTAEPSDGYTFKSWEVNYKDFIQNPLKYFVSGLEDPIDVLAIFERNGEFAFSTHRVEIPYDGGSASVGVTSSKKWALDPITEEWLSVSPKSGEAGTTDILIEIGDSEYDKFMVRSQDSDDYEEFVLKTGGSVGDEMFVKNK